MNDASEGAAQPKSRTRMRLFGINIKHLGRQRRTATWRFAGIALTSAALLIGAAVPASAAESMRVTFVRHGESAGNASGLIDTSTPGPVLTPLGQQQARDVVDLLGDNNYDAIYASTMVRTQLTAAPMSQCLRLPVKVLPGLQEIEAGVFEGTPEAGASRGYGLYPIGWALPGVIPQIPVDRFNKDTVMPGTNLNGHDFDARVDGALQSMYDNGDRNAVVFSHGGAIMFWTMMNVNNLSATQKLQLLQTAALGNTDYVVIEGNNEDGWTLVDWNGQRFAPEPTLGSEIALQTRTLQRQLAAAANQVAQAFATGDITKILTAITRGVADAVFSVSKFHRAVNAKIISEIGKVVSPPAQSEDTPAPHSEVASVMAAPRTMETPDVAPRSGSASRSASDSAQPTSTATDPETTTPAEDVSTDETTATDGDKAATAATTRPAENRGQYTDDVRDYFSRFTRKRSEAADKSDGTTTGTDTTGTTSDGSSANVNSAGADSGDSDSDSDSDGDSDSDSDSDSDNGGSQRDAA